LGTSQFLEATSDLSANSWDIRFETTDTLSFGGFLSGVSYRLTTTQVFRDPSAWYHFVIAVDTTQATDTNRYILYVNGSRVTAVTATYPPQNSTLYFNGAVVHNIGRSISAANYFDGYMDEINFIDGQALTPASFGSTNPTTGVWQPAKYTGTYGTNGFYLPFTNTTSTTTLGNDFSGNGNNWTTNNISLTPGATYDAMTDVPTLTSPTAANFATLNPLKVGATPGDVIANGNLRFFNTNSTWYNTRATIQPPISGKYYVEFTSTQNYTVNNVSFIGLCTPAMSLSASSGDIVTLYNNTTSGEVLALAIDRVNNQVSTYRNNSLVGTTSISATNDIDIVVGAYAASGDINFGQRPFAYTPPSGFVALNTFNLPSSTIQNGASFMAATLATGNNSTQVITNTVGSASFQPDFVWMKIRSTSENHIAYDSVRGVQNYIVPNLTLAEGTSSQGLTSFNSNGFTLGNINPNYTGSPTFVAWQWRANGAGVTNTAGSITSTVSANTTSGFSVVTYTGTGANATVGHGLGVAPSMMIFKVRSTTNDWAVYHSALATPATQALFLNLTLAVATTTTAWNSTAPTSSVFSIGNSSPVNVNAATFVAYCFAPIAGFSAFGSYTGNGSTDGPFIYTGFRPRWIMCKSSTDSGSWTIIDTARIGYNANNSTLYADLSSTEQGYLPADILSNGFKIRITSTGTSFNTSGQTYIYAAFAENPFKNALAR
jgi:hypothetical protein